MWGNSSRLIDVVVEVCIAVANWRKAATRGKRFTFLREFSKQVGGAN